MNNATLRDLSTSQRLALKELHKKDPALVDQVLALIRQAETARLKASLAAAQLPDDVRAKVESIDLTTATGNVVEHLRVKLVEQGVSPDHLKTVVHHAHKARLGHGVHPKQPVGTQPDVAGQLALTHVQDITTLAGLTGAAAAAVAKVAVAPRALTNAALAGLVSSNALTDAQAKDLGFAATLHQLADENAAVATAIRSGTFSQLGGKSPTSAADLAKLGAADWSTFLTSSKVALPANVTPASAGAALAARFADLYPNLALTGRLPVADPAGMTADLSELAPLYQQNTSVVGASFGQLATKGLSPAQLTAMQTSVTRLQQLDRAYSGLGLAAILDDPKTDASTKTATIARRIGLVNGVTAILGDTQVLRLDLSATSADVGKLGLDLAGATADEKNMVVSVFKTYQRSWAVAKNVTDAQALVGAGFTSAMSIGTVPLATFVQQTGFEASKGKRVWDEARVSTANTAQMAGAALDVLSGPYRTIAVSNQPATAGQYLAQLPGYQDLFGSISFCDCEECRSILGPAAYFVDLMKFIDDNLRNQLRPNDPIDLQVRRPDLWTLVLSCDNTNDRVPTLDLVNEILENYIALKQPPPTPALTDRTAVGKVVYEQTLTQVVQSFPQPFYLPFPRIVSYLAALGSSWPAVTDAVVATPPERAQSELGLSAPVFSIIRTVDANLGHLSQLYGLPFVATATGTLGVTDPTTGAPGQIDASTVYPPMGLTRAELGQLVGSAFVAAGGATVTIVAAARNAQSVQNDVEWVNGLTADALDRMHRFTLLRGKTGWAVPDLDLVLAALGITGLTNAEDIEAVAVLHALQSRFNLSIGDLCALVGLIPVTPAGTSFFDQLFNAPSAVAQGGSLPSTTAQSTMAAARLMAGLGVDRPGLEALINHLANPLVASTGVFTLSLQNLTYLYRHARLARMLGVGIDDLFQLLGFLGPTFYAPGSVYFVGATPAAAAPTGWPAALASLAPLVALYDWWKASGYTLDDVAYAMGQAPRDPSKYLDPGTVAGQIVASAAKALTFTSTAFATALGVSEQGSLDLLASLSASGRPPSIPGSVPPVLQQSPTDGSWSVIPGVDLATPPTFTIPATATVTTPANATTGAITASVTPAAVMQALQPYLPSEVLKRSLGKALGFTTDKVVSLASLAGQSLTAAAVASVVRGDQPVTRPLPSPPPASPPPADALSALVASLLPLAVVLAPATWNALPPDPAGSLQPSSLPPIDFVRQHPAVFGATTLPLPNVTLAQLRALSAHASFTQQLLAASPPGAPGDLQAVLLAFDPSVPGFPATADAATARVLGAPSGIVTSVRGATALPATVAVDGLGQLARAIQLASTLRIDGPTLAALASNDYDKLSSAADTLVVALGARYTDASTRATKLDLAEQPVREAKRDALADYLIHSVTPKVWSTLDDLYEYFLIDVATGGCATTSRVVSATMAVQLYVYRATMNLEQSPSGVSLKLPDEPAAEWTWRKNYRVWQANREVFLWPENYLEPDLRDDKTPLFQDLESQLLQTDITDENVLDAYTNYLAGLQEVASLTIAGAYVDHPPTDSAGTGADSPAPILDILHLFGVTADDPPVYYYRTCQNFLASGSDPNTAAVWSGWQKITVQITGRRVCPIVYDGRLSVFWTDIKTQPTNTVAGGNSTFTGYKHNLSLKFTTLRPDATWTAPQAMKLPVDANFGPTGGQIADAVSTDVVQIAKYDPQWRKQTEAIDDYTLSGPNWDWAWAFQSGQGAQLGVQLRNFMASYDLDLFARKTLPSSAPDPRAPSQPFQLSAQDTPQAQTAYAARQRVLANDTALLTATATLNTDLGTAQTALTTLMTGGANNFQTNYANYSAAQQTVYADKVQVDADKTAVLTAADASAVGALTAEAAATAGSSTKALSAGLWWGSASPAWSTWPAAAFANAIIDEARLDVLEIDLPGWKSANLLPDPTGVTTTSTWPGYTFPVATIPSDTGLLALPGSEGDAVLQVGNDVLLLQGLPTLGILYDVRRLGTTLAEDIARRLFEGGVDAVLATQTQYDLQEAAIPITLGPPPSGPLTPVPSSSPPTYASTDNQTHVVDHSNAGQLDFAGAYGVYYQEIFFHIPFLIANVLNSRGNYESAQRWYDYIFDPTSSDTANIDTSVPAAELAHRLLDRVWRYKDFRGRDVEGLRFELTRPEAIAAYRLDPFNPWAIARYRISALQKSIVMNYVGNLLDWGDSLFTQFTMETVNEALMLYIMASDILGPRPAELGDCGAGDTPVTYAMLAPLIDPSTNPGSDILVELETWAIGARVSSVPTPATASGTTGYTIEPGALVGAAARHPLVPSIATTTTAASEVSMFSGLGWDEVRTTAWVPALANSTAKSPSKAGGKSVNNAGKGKNGPSLLGLCVVRQALAFCIPDNPDLLALWDRVEDRLYKIRHCMDINGQLHALALFAPPINPMQLVAMKAAGLSLDQVLGASNGDLPPYRFLYLIDRAKAFAASVSGFGAALLSSLEKKDGEQLNRLRLSQQMNLAQLTTQTRQFDIDAATASLAAVGQQLTSAQYRSSFYAGLLSAGGGRNEWEIAQSIGIHTASGIKGLEGLLGTLGAITHLLPDLGSPFSMKYGGLAIGNSIGRFSAATRALSEIAEGVAASAGLEATFARRNETWQNQKSLADFDVQSLTSQQQAAQIRLNIASDALVLHQKSIGQIQEMLDLMDGKFTSMGLYTWLSQQLQVVYHGAYQNALALGNLAEQAWRFERSDYTSPGLLTSYWDASHGGLLAGEQLLVDLQTLERRFIETNYRQLEVDQTFALSQIAPAALLDLRESGECTFTVGEVFFDLFYPGHYKRRIKAVRLTVPCITGPYTNVSATLNLLGSSVRTTPSAPLVAVPPTRSVSIATSTAQNDAGVFELSFRDERYMPFEGLGAVESTWNLVLPKAFRQFDYETINDVILSISYTADQDSSFRTHVEGRNALLQESILGRLTDNTRPAGRLFSLRQDFSSAFTRLLRSPLNTPVNLEISDRSFPMFLRGRRLRIQNAQLVLRPGADPTATTPGTPIPPGNFAITLDGTTVVTPPGVTPPNAFTASTTLGGLQAASLASIACFSGLADPNPSAGGPPGNLFGKHTVAITAADNFAGSGSAAPIDGELLQDILIYVEYVLAP